MWSRTARKRTDNAASEQTVRRFMSVSSDIRLSILLPRHASAQQQQQQQQQL